MKSVGNEEGRGKRSLLGLSLEALFSGGRHFPSPLLCSQGTFPDKHTDLFSTPPSTLYPTGNLTILLLFYILRISYISYISYMYSHLMGRAPSKECSLRKMVESSQDRKISMSPIPATGQPPETPPRE